MLKVNYKDHETLHWCCSGAFIANSGHNPYLFLVCLLLTLNRKMFVGLGKVCIGEMWPDIQNLKTSKNIDHYMEIGLISLSPDS